MNNTFVLNATINSIRNEKEEALDMQVYDIEKCDTLWLHEVINSLYEAGGKKRQTSFTDPRKLKCTSCNKNKRKSH